MLLSRTKAAKPGKEKAPGGDPTERKKRKKPKMEEFIDARDYTGAITLLEFNKQQVKESKKEDDKKKEEDLYLWLGYAYFHNGDFKNALRVYEEWVSTSGANIDPSCFVYIGCCQFYLGMYNEARDSVLKAASFGPGYTTGLQNRLLFHIAHKSGNEELLMAYHARLQDVYEDQMCLASVHYLRGHFNEAIEIYKRLLGDNKKDIALNVYMAMCYYKLEYHDVSQEALSLYLNAHADSAIAINLKACNHFKLYDGRTAEQELKKLHDISSPNFKFGQDIVRHNTVVFRTGENALQVLPPLVDVIPEARLNLVIYHLHNDEIEQAHELMKDVEAISPQEYILKGVVNAAYGQLFKSVEHLKTAQSLFQIVGSSASECDTIPGRQCMASCLYLLKQFEDVLVYLSSIKMYFYNDDDFNYNYGVAKAACGHYKEAEEAFLLIQNERYRGEVSYQGWLARCYIMNGNPKLAWDLYARMETTNEAFNFLNLIANDCYKMGHFHVAARAFEVLERMDPNPVYWEAKRGACIGLFQQIIAEEEPKELLREVIAIMQTTSNPQVDYVISAVNKWAKSNHILI